MRLLQPKHWNKQVVIVLDAAGKSGLYAGHELTPVAQKLLSAGAAVVGVDLVYQCEFLGDGKSLDEYAVLRFATSRDLPSETITGH